MPSLQRAALSCFLAVRQDLATPYLASGLKPAKLILGVAGREAHAGRAELCLRFRGRSTHGRHAQEGRDSEGQGARRESRDEGTNPRVGNQYYCTLGAPTFRYGRTTHTCDPAAIFSTYIVDRR